MNPLANLRRVFILTNTLKSGGAEKQAIYLTKALAQHYDVRLVVYYGGSFDKRMRALLKGYEDRVIWLNGSHLNKWFFLYRIFRNKPKPVIISYLATTNFINAIIGSVTGVKIKIGGIRSSKFSRWKRIVQQALHNKILTRTVFNNQKGLDELTQKGFFKHKAVVIPNCVSVPEVVSTKTTNNNITILTVARFVEAKNYQVAFDSVKALSESTKSNCVIKYIIVGHGPLEPSLKEYVKLLGLDNVVEFVNNPTNIEEYYLKADIFLLTSLYEGLSNAIMEAMAYGLPVVATDVGDNDKLVINGKTGFLHPIKDVKGIASSLSELIDNPSLRQELGKNGREHIVNNYAIDAFRNKYISLIEGFSNEK